MCSAPAWVLVHSPMMGPAVWAGVAGELRARGRTVVLPSLKLVADAPPPQWPVAVEAVRAATEGIEAPVMLAGHSAAGVLLPPIATAIEPEVAGILFVDSLLPPSAGVAPSGPMPLIASLRSLAVDGRIPPLWSWFGEDLMSELVPDEELRATLEADMPPFPLSYFDTGIEMPVGWGDRRCGYVLLGPEFYGATAENARNRGWPVREIGGGHLAPASRPVRVTEALLELEGVLRTAPAPPRFAPPAWPAGSPGGTASRPSP